MVNKLKLVGIFVFLIILLGIPVMAQQGPSTEISASFTDEGLIIENIEYFDLKQNRSFEFNFHVVNESNGFLMRQPTVSCEFNLYNQTGGHIVVNKNLDFFEDEGDYEIIIDAGNFTSLGDYAYITHCNDSRIGGFVAAPLVITKDGNSLTSNITNNSATASTIALAVAALIIFLIGNSFKTEDQKWYHILFRAIFYMFSLGFVALGIGLQNVYISNVENGDTLLVTTVDSAVILFTRFQFIFFTIIFIVAITTIIFNILTNKKNKEDPYGNNPGQS
jgi:hypothetical protein